MGATVAIADQKAGYTLTDHSTYLRFRAKVDLVSLSARSDDLKNIYGVLVVNPNKHPSVRKELADAFADFLISPQAQRLIANYQLLGEALFVPMRFPPAQ